MGSLSQWLPHRARILGMTWPAGVCEASGVGSETINLIVSSGSLSSANRSARGLLARALKVSLRDLEELTAGRKVWIADTHRVDWDRITFSSQRCVDASRAVPAACAPGSGVAVVGRVSLEFGVEFASEQFAPEAVRLAVRYPNAPDAFALELAASVPPYAAGTLLVLEALPPGQIQAGELTLICWGGGRAESMLCFPTFDPQQMLNLRDAVSGSQRSAHVHLCDVLRAARVIGAHPFCRDYD